MKKKTTIGVKTLLIAAAMLLSIRTIDAQVQIVADTVIVPIVPFGLIYQARAVSMPDANIVAIGATMNRGGSGHVRIDTWNGTAWVQKGVDINGEATIDYSGGSVSMPDANTVAIGAVGNNGGGIDAGHVRVYTWNGTAWVQKGVDIDGEGAGHGSGDSVSMPDANTLAVGHAYSDSGRSVRVYTWNGTAWVQ